MMFMVVFFLLFVMNVEGEQGETFLHDITTLIKKYSNISADHLNERQIQNLISNLQKCRVSNKTTVSKIDCNCTGNCDLDQVCLSAEYIYKFLDIKNGKFDGNLLQLACPLILMHLEGHTCDIIKEENLYDAGDVKKPTTIEVWGLGFLFVTIISLCSLLGVAFLPFMDKDFYKQLLMVLIGLAVGSLSASSVFHLIPQAFGLVDKDLQHKYLNVSFMLWAGIWVFFMTERIMKIISDTKNRMHCHADLPCKSPASGAVSSVASPTELLPGRGRESEEQAPDGCVLEQLEQLERYSYPAQPPAPAVAAAAAAARLALRSNELPRDSHSHTRQIYFDQGKDSVVATVAWMIIFGDGLHNFIDGLSIGAAFSESMLTGISISVAVMCEELPHELGDFAVLLNAGMTMRQALVYNFLSACTCYLGLILGILLGEFEASTYIFGFAAGMFLYISLVDMMPELNEAAEEASKISVKGALKTLTLQNIGLIVGVVMLFILARFQDKFSFI